jgi:hypothetical protein
MTGGRRVTGVASFALLGMALAMTPAAVLAQDEAGVRRAALDYLEGFYEGSDEKLRRSIHPEMNKFGFSRRGPNGEYVRIPMSYDQVFQFAADVRAGQAQPPAGAPKDVHILDVQDQTAVVKVIAWWGQDYLQMARYDGQWMIVHVLWQSLDGDL